MIEQLTNNGFFLIAGPCVIESEAICDEIAAFMKTTCDDLGIPWVFKASFDKANRTSAHSFRGVGIEQGLKVLETIRSRYNVPVLTDIHTEGHVDEVASVVDILQIPAFLCRQTNLITRAAQTGKIVNIKKGQFLAPWDMKPVVEKARATPGCGTVMVCERGTTFGYNNLVVDMRGLVTMREATSCPVVFDATHSVQLPGGDGHQSSGQRQFVAPLARAAVAVGVQGLFMETHPDPTQAKSDGANSMYLEHMPALLAELKAIDSVK